MYHSSQLSHDHQSRMKEMPTRIQEFQSALSRQTTLKCIPYHCFVNKWFIQWRCLIGSPEPLGKELAFFFFTRYKNILTLHSYFIFFQVESFFFSALAMMWHLIMDSPEIFPWGLLHQKYLFRRTPVAFFIMIAAPHGLACY